MTQVRNSVIQDDHFKKVVSMIVQCVAACSSGHCPKGHVLHPVPFTMHTHLLDISYKSNSRTNSCCMRYSLALQGLLHTDSGAGDIFTINS